MDLELEYAAAQLTISGNYSSGFVAKSRGQQTLSLGTDNVPIAITGYYIYIDSLTDSNQVFLGTQNDATETAFDQGWNQIDITGKVTNGAADTSNAGISFIDNLIINPVEDASMLMTKVPQFVNDDFTKMSTSSISVEITDIVHEPLVGEEEECEMAVDAAQLSISVTDLDGTSFSANHTTFPAIYLASAGAELTYSGHFGPTSGNRATYSSGLNPLSTSTATVNPLGNNMNQWSGSAVLGAGLAGAVFEFTEGVEFKISRNNIFEISVSDSFTSEVECLETPTSTTTTTTAEGGS